MNAEMKKTAQTYKQAVKRMTQSEVIYLSTLRYIMWDKA